jgi:hypothetical protein
MFFISGLSEILAKIANAASMKPIIETLIWAIVPKTEIC